jgi:argininosuccinate synthase
MISNVKKVVLAYSGGLDTSVILKWLKNEFGCEVIAFTADVGQAEELDHLEEKAIKTGASKVYIEDLREEFVRDFVFPMFRANALYEGVYLLGTSIARPLIAKRQIEIAKLTDHEERHAKADDLMCDLLSALGYDRGVRIFRGTTRFYA